MSYIGTQDERDLLRLAKSCDSAEAKRSIDELVRRYRPTVQSLVDEYWKPYEWEQRRDLVQAANLGLIEAILSFDLNRNSDLRAHCDIFIRNQLRGCVQYFCLGGDTSDTRADRWVRRNSKRYALASDGPSEEAIEACQKAEGCSAWTALDAIQRHLNVRYMEQLHYTITDGDGNRKTYEHTPSSDHAMYRKYSSFHAAMGKPRLYIRSTVLIDLAIRLSEQRAIRRLREVGRRQYALELVERDHKKNLLVNEPPGVWQPRKWRRAERLIADELRARREAHETIQQLKAARPRKRRRRRRNYYWRSWEQTQENRINV